MSAICDARFERDLSTLNISPKSLKCLPQSLDTILLSTLDNVKYHNTNRFLVKPCQKKYKCPICEQLLNEPIQTVRGVLACRHCYQDNRRQDGNCPVDGEPVGEVFPDKFTLREINSLQCMCVNVERGCQWIGSLSDIAGHEEKCDYRIIKCTLCHDDVIKKWIGEHNDEECIHRDSMCQFCDQKIQITDIEVHVATCGSRPSPCPFNCDEILTRAETYLHVNKCRNIQAGVICPYYAFGCTFQPTSPESLSLHLNNDSLSHVCLVTKSMNFMKKEFHDLTCELNKEKTRTSHLENELKQVKEEMNVMSQEHERQMKIVTEQQVTLETQLTLGKQLTTGKQQKTNALETNPTSETCNRLEKLESFMSTFNFEKDETFQKVLSMQSKLDNIVPNKDLVNYLQNKQSLEQLTEKLEKLETTQAHCISQLSDAETNLQLLENTTYNGRMVWRIDNFSYRTKQAEIGKITILHSAPCYTNMSEYKFCSRLYLNGDGVGKCSHLSLFVCFMKSPFDDQLEWPVKKKVTFRLLHPVDKTKSCQEFFFTDPKSSSFAKPKREMNVAAGCPMFIEKENIFREGFVINDCIYIETIVE